MNDYLNVLDNGYIRLVKTWGDDLDVVNSARVSYNKESNELNDRDKSLIKYLIRNKEYAPFRHQGVTWEVYAPLMVARQWWKYHVASAQTENQDGWSESSRRYITEEPVFYVPEVWFEAPENAKQGTGAPASPSIANPITERLKEFYVRSQALYDEALALGLAPEQARLFLPAYGMYVRWRWSISLNGMLHFLDERLGHGAQTEINQYAQAAIQLLEPYFPYTVEAWRQHG